jgi:hypothetical protein
VASRWIDERERELGDQQRLHDGQLSVVEDDGREDESAECRCRIEEP